jgi:hypothetical protein
MTLLKPSGVGAEIYYRLRDNYLTKIPYGNEFSVKVDQDPIMSRDGIREDHIAFRTFSCPVGDIPNGFEFIERIFCACGWSRAKDENGEEYRYDFPHMKVKAIHLEYPEDRPDLPKIFVSQLMVDELENKDDVRRVKADLNDAKDPLTAEDKDILDRCSKGESFEKEELEASGFFDRCFKALERPWMPPHRETILEVDKKSQYAAWTLLNGGLNHVAYLTSDLDATAEAHAKAGRQLLPNIMQDAEGTLRQTSVRSPMFEFEVSDGEHHDDHEHHGESGMLRFEVREKDDTIGTIMWTGPFAELIERPLKADGSRRENFLPGNAAHIFASTQNLQHDAKNEKAAASS